jgi:glycosyltransferase involved in cell wall biosynthesis
MTFANRNQGGTGVYARSLFAALRERDDVAAWVIAGPSRSNPVGTARWLVRGAKKALKAKPPDLVHCPSFVAPWGITVPFVVTIHDAGARVAPADHPLEWRAYDRMLMPARLRAAAAVITGSEFARREVSAAYGLDPDRVVAIPYGLDSRFFETQTVKQPRNNGGPILFPGAPVGRKNIDAVLRCMAVNPGSSLGSVELEISGAREQDFPAVIAQIRSLGLESRVRWLGQVPQSVMPGLIASASVVVYPSFYEGFGFPPLEAMAVGTPVVASDRGSLPEVLDGAALLIDPTDDRQLSAALESVLTRPELRQRLSEAGKERARNFTWDRCADSTLDLYRSVLKESSRAA